MFSHANVAKQASMPPVVSTVEVDLDLLRRLDQSGPRYTSYPTADRFVEAFGAEAYESWLARRNVGGVQRPLSLYVHLPFCNTICYYCGCNKVVTRDKSKGDAYLKYVAAEIALRSGALSNGDSRVEQMHWGGGTPNFFRIEQLAGLFNDLRSNFDMDPHGEYSIEIDPRYADPAYIAELHDLGFNRISMGVQDFDPEVQRAVHRIQNEAATLELIAATHRCGFQSVNIDLIYGLPKQTLISFDRTLARVIEASPDRVALYNYPHPPP